MRSKPGSGWKSLSPGEETDHPPEGVGVGFVVGKTLEFRNGLGMLLSAAFSSATIRLPSR